MTGAQAQRPGDPHRTRSGAGGEGDAGGGLPSLRAGLEAVLLVVDEPVAEATLAQAVQRPPEEVARALRELAEEYTAQRRGFDLRAVAGGWRLYTRAECAPVVQRFVRGRQQARLSQAALETLAIVAYRQPVTRARVSAVRGVNVDAVMRRLVQWGLVEEAPVQGEHGAACYRTTDYFLELLGLHNLEELPDLAPYLPERSDLPDEGAAAAGYGAGDGHATDSGGKDGRE